MTPLATAGRVRYRSRRARSLAWSLALAVAVALGAAGRLRAAENPALQVVFSANGSISVSLPDGQAVGSSSGTPTQIAAGYYTILLSGPGGCAELPVFALEGPGVDIVNNLDDGEVNSTGYQVEFQPNASYTWTDAASPGVVNTFTTSSEVEGSAPTTSTASPPLTAPPRSVASTDLVGAQVRAPAATGIRGVIDATLSARGTLLAREDGRRLTHLAAGRYTVVVHDRSASHGVVLREVGHAMRSLAGGPFVGVRRVVVTLATGRWALVVAPGTRALSFQVG